jgi:F-type H+-transporting ATPase subunit b
MLSFTRKFGWFAAVALGVMLYSAQAVVAQPAEKAEEAAAEAEHAADEAAHEAAHEAAETEAAGDPNPLAVRTDLALWTFVVFVVLFGLLSYFAWPQIAAALDERERKISENISAAEARLADAQSVLAAHEAKLAEAAAEVRALLEEARRDAEHTRRSIEADGHKAAKEELDRALREINRARDAAVQDLAVTSANVAIDLARNVVRTEISSERQKEIVREAVGKLNAAAPSKN